MKLILNDKEIECNDNITLTELIDDCFPQDAHIAVAVNNQVVTKNKWRETLLKEGDSILIIKASHGG